MSKDLGLVKAIHSGATAPSNPEMIWYDTTASVHKYYNTATATWSAFAAAASDLATVLGAGGASGASDIDMAAGQNVSFASGSFKSEISAGSLTANRSIQLPDVDGTLATTADLSTGTDITTILAAPTGGVDIKVSNGDKVISPDVPTSIDMNDGGAVKINAADAGSGSAFVKASPTTGLELSTDTKVSINADDGISLGVPGDVDKATIKVARTGVQLTSEVNEKSIQLQATDASGVTTSGLEVSSGGASVPFIGQGLMIGGTLANLPNKSALGVKGNANTNMSVSSTDTAGIALYTRASGSETLRAEISATDATGIFKIRSMTENMTLSTTESGVEQMALEASAHNITFGRSLAGATQSITVSSNNISTVNELPTLKLTAAAPITVHDIAAGRIDGEERLLMNVGANAITLAHKGGGTGNVMTPGAVDKVLNTKEAVRMVFSTDFTGWLIIG